MLLPEQEIQDQQIGLNRPPAPDLFLTRFWALMVTVTCHLLLTSFSGQRDPYILTPVAFALAWAEENLLTVSGEWW